MRLTVLGGSAAGPNTGAGCSGYLVDSGQTRLVLDLGPGTLPELRRHADFRELSAVVISHLHLDHLLDLFALRFALAYNPVSARYPLPLWLPPGGRGFLRAASKVFAGEENAAAFIEDVFDAREYDPDQALTIGDTQIVFCPTQHFVPCWAMRVSPNGGEGDLSFTADTGPTSALAPFILGSATLVAEGTQVVPPLEGEPRGHLTPEEAGALAEAANVSVLVITHLWEEHGLDLAGERARREFPGRVEVAVPGFTVTW